MTREGQPEISPETGAEQPSPARAGIWRRLMHSDSERVRELAARTPAWFVFLALFALAALHLMTDPFGFSRLTQRYAQDVANLTVTGLIYPPTGQDQVSVARIDDSTLSGLGGLSWPVSYDFHATALQRLLDYGPRAVVVDILFVDLREDASLQRLLTAIDAYKRAKVPLYFVGAPQAEKPVRPEIAASGVALVDPTLVLDQGVARQYLETDTCLGVEREGGSAGLVRSFFWRCLASARVRRRHQSGRDTRPGRGVLT